MRLLSARLLSVIGLALAAGSASAAEPHCMARIIADVPAEEAPEQVKSKSNADFGPVTRIKVDKKSGRMTYCAKNSYCYWSNAFEIVSPCRVKREDSDDPTFFRYFTR